MELIHCEEHNRSIYWQLVPFGINLEEKLKNNPPSFVYNFDFFVHLLHLTIQLPAKNKELRSSDGYVPLNAALLQLRNRDYYKHLDYLIQEGILECDNHYVPGIKSRSYRIAEQYLNKQLWEVMVSDKQLMKHLAKEYRLDFTLKHKYNYLQKWFNKRLEVDTGNAIKYSVGQLNENGYESLYENYQKVYAQIAGIKMLQHGQYWFTEDKFGKRIHTNLTNLSSKMKQFVTYNGQQLVSVDITNSQPYLSIKVLGDLFPEVIEYYRKHPISSNIFMLVNKSEIIENQDVYKFVFYVASGQLYEFLLAEMREAFGDEYFTRPCLMDRTYFKKNKRVSKPKWVKNDKTPRQLAKDVFFQIIFSKNTQHTKEKKLFKKLFPNVMRVFESTKSLMQTHKQKSHKKLSRLLQKIETDIVVRGVAKNLSAKYPHMPLYTIHDNIVTTIANKEIVANELHDALLKNIGLPPKLAYEYWDSNRTKEPVEIAA